MMYGMPSLIEAPDLRSCFAIARRLGLDFIELNMNLPEHQPDAVDIDLARALMSETGIHLTLHLPEALNPCDFDPIIREANVRSALSAIGLARALGCPLVNMHMADGIYFTLPGERVYLFDRYPDRYLQSLAAFRDACAEAVGDSGLLICVENCGLLPFQRAGIDALLECDSFALTFDVGHDHPAHQDEPFIMARADRLRHMHIHDALTGHGNHLALGDGEIDIRRMLAIAKRHGCAAVVEVKTLAALERSIQYINRAGR